MADALASPQQQAQQPETPINLDAIKAATAEAVKGTVAQLQQDQARQQQQAQQAQAQRQQAQQLAGDPLAQVIGPYVAPAFQQLAIQAASANDKADFYLSHPEAVHARAEIEAAHQASIQRGQPMDRESLYFYQRGRDPQAWQAREDQFRNERLQQLGAQFATAGMPAMGRPEAPSLNSETFASLPLDQMREALKGRTF